MPLTAEPMTALPDLPATSVATEPVPKRRGTLLIVDDEDGPRQSLRMVFKDEYDLLLAEDGPTAIKLAQENDIHVAVLDIRMPGMTGIDVLEQLKFVKPDIEAIMLTAYETTDTIRRALQLRACDYLNKPFDLAAMRAAVSKAMKRRRLEGEIDSNAKKIHELFAELQEQRLAEKIAQERGDIYAHIFHDINNPLTIISGFVTLLNQRLNHHTRLELEDLEFIKQKMEIITRQTTSCIEISRRYHDSLRHRSAGSGTPRTSASQLLKDLEALLQSHPSAPQNELILTPFGEGVGVRINPTEAIQILRNLAVNALQCTPQPHRVEVGGEVLRSPLDLAALRDGPHDRFLFIESLDNTAPLVKFWVRDTGPGIPAEVLPKIFQQYFTTKGPREGTGLGLNIVQRFVKEGHGALHCHTESGEGTIFTVYLPGAELAN
jgi:signal transduction histidine kinase